MSSIFMFQIDKKVTRIRDRWGYKRVMDKIKKKKICQEVEKFQNSGF